MLNPIQWSLILAVLAPLLVLHVALYFEFRWRDRWLESPQGENLLRPPGYSLGERMGSLMESMMISLLVTMFYALLAGTAAVLMPLILILSIPGTETLAWLAGGLGTAGLAAVTAWRLVQTRRLLFEYGNVRLGMRGEQAVAESLAALGECGYRAFHDLPGGGNWNIDHVVVGEQGVFVLETKARRRRVTRDGTKKHVATIDGDWLRFPTGYDPDAIPQARRNASWLSNFLSKETGESVSVQPMVVVPGWYVEGGKEFPPKAMNASYLEKYLRSLPKKLKPAQVRRIWNALDKKCRDVAF